MGTVNTATNSTSATTEFPIKFQTKATAAFIAALLLQFINVSAKSKQQHSLSFMICLILIVINNCMTTTNMALANGKYSQLIISDKHNTIHVELNHRLIASLRFIR